jgi:hypothetical protein
LDLNRITSLILDDYVDFDDHDDEGDDDENDVGDDDNDGILIISTLYTIPFFPTAVFSINDINKY